VLLRVMFSGFHIGAAAVPVQHSENRQDRAGVRRSRQDAQRRNREMQAFFENTKVMEAVFRQLAMS